MAGERLIPVFKRLDTLEWKACNKLARLGAYRPLLFVLRWASRLGAGMDRHVSEHSAADTVVVRLVSGGLLRPFSSGRRYPLSPA